ncbi:uncharacterized protein LOC129919330 [Episyrphus balteatus]|uniref:uncharacterized protein LOC129919330 n=1 Tax=Episyrphus balteatus TaxID=286459 RepID=UPI0024869418|nr:uncharacterized protein LOC129919330 [Episyrphus balteatus]
MPITEAPSENFESSPESSHSGDVPPPPANPEIPAPFLNVNPNPNVEQIFLRRSLSNISLDIAEIEEDDNYPGRAYLLPVVLPNVTEPTLDELLRRVTGRHDIQNVDSVKLRVISYMVSLCRLSLFMPRLVHLDLSGSVLNSLRDLGCGLIHLTHLNVSNCGLSSVDGTSCIPTIEVLIADGNMIQLVGPLSTLVMLKKLSLKNNRISDLGMLTFLGMCTNLIDVELQGNPVTNYILYRRTLQRNLPSLELLDGQPFTDDNEMVDGAVVTFGGDDTTDAESSLSDEIYSEGSNSLVSIASATLDERPSTSGGICNVAIIKPDQRPMSSSGTSFQRSSSLQGNPVVGTVLGIARMRKRSQQSAWGSSTSSSSSSSSLDANRVFPNRLPQTILPPLLRNPSQESNRASFSGSDESYSSLQEIARRWREEISGNNVPIQKRENEEK